MSGGKRSGRGRVGRTAAAAALLSLALASAAAAAPALIEGALGPVPPDEPRNVAYAHGYYILYFVNAGITLGFFLALLASGLSARLWRWAAASVAWRGPATALYVAAVVLLGFFAGLPVDLFVYFRERRYGFMNMSLAGWFGDQIKVLLIAMTVQAVFFPILYVAIRRMKRSWWLAGAGLAIVFVVAGMVIAPVFLAPLFNTFTPLQDEALRADILALAHAQGIPAGEVYQVDASRQSQHTNAYVAGILGTQRIVLYDTLLERFAPREIRAVMGHEMGHYVLHHVWKTIALIAVAIVAGLFAVDRIGRRILRARPGWGIAGLEEPASLPLIVLLVTLFSLLGRPAINTYSRGQEAAADEFGMNVVRDPEAAASVFRKFAREDLEEMHVPPIIEMVLYTHPSIAHRVEQARAWARAHPPEALQAGGP